MIEHRRLQVDARKWILARMDPKKYGDKIEQTVEQKTTVTVNAPTTEQALKEIRELRKPKAE
jgi:hypothetical protein